VLGTNVPEGRGERRLDAADSLKGSPLQLRSGVFNAASRDRAASHPRRDLDDAIIDRSGDQTSGRLNAPAATRDAMRINENFLELRRGEAIEASLRGTGQRASSSYFRATSSGEEQRE